MIKLLQKTVLALGLTAGMAFATHAQAPEDAMGPHGPSPLVPPPIDMPPGPNSGTPPSMVMRELSPPPFLHGLDLSEAQQDKIFNIILAEAPLVHEQEKLAHRSGKEMHELLEQDQYDEGKIRALAESQAHAMAQLMVLHARAMHQILAVLTQDQKKQLDSMKEKFARARKGEEH